MNYASESTALSPEEVISGLDDLQVLDLEEHSPWPELGEDDEAFSVHVGDLFEDGWLDGAGSSVASVEPWEAAAEQILEGVGAGAPNVLPPMAMPDVAAWYQPIHYFGPNWGIFIRESAVIQIAVLMAGFVPRRHRRPEIAWHLYRMALATLFLHEHYHHKVESFAIRLEVVEMQKRYAPADLQVYRPLLGTDLQLEEALANADAYLRLARDPYRRDISRVAFKAAREYLRWSFPLSPPGYRKATDYLKPEQFAPAEDVLAAQIHEASPTPRTGSFRWRMAPHLFRSLFNCHADTWIVIPRGGRPVGPWFDRHPVPDP